MKKEPEEKSQSERPEHETQAPKKRPDRSRHMAWDYDDVEHHGNESKGTRRLKSFKTWTDERT